MKVVIVGGGISGLVSYLFLKKHLPNPAPPADAHEFLIYESHDASRNLERQLHSKDASRQTTNIIAIGGALGLGPNGLNVIKRLDESMFHEIVRSGHSITLWKMLAARGWELGSVAIHTEEELPMNSLMIGRQTLWHCIREHVPDAVIVQKKISKVVAAAGKRPFISFADGTPDMDCDLVVGCDGLRSIVRKAIFSDVSEESNERYPPHYEGLIGVGGFIPSALLLDNGVKNGEMGIVFGANGFFGYGYNTSSPRGQKKNLPYETCEPGNEANWWSTYYLDECPDWRLVDSEDAKRQLVARHSSWKNPVIQEIIKNVQIDSVYPTWTTPELPTWERAGLVLVGDAAHALHPSSGQGANQALEDSECFSLLLSHHLRAAYLKPQNSQWKTERVAVEQAAKDYSNMRMPRLEKIRERSAAIGDFKKPKTLVQEMFMYLFIWSIKFIRVDTYTRQLTNYNGPAEVEKVLAASRVKQA